jgi:isopenicillin N synthase-like dioxygenase
MAGSIKVNHQTTFSKRYQTLTALSDLSEAFNWAYDPVEDPDAVQDCEPSASIWPSDLPGFREGLYAYHTQLLRLARQLTRIFALSLRLPETSFDEYIRKPEAGMRILHYPEQSHSVDDQNGIGAHTDVECFTMDPRLSRRPRSSQQERRLGES